MFYFKTEPLKINVNKLQYNPKKGKPVTSHGYVKNFIWIKFVKAYLYPKLLNPNKTATTKNSKHDKFYPW